MKAGSFVKWTSSDGTKPFTYVGKVVSASKDSIEMLTVDGVMGFSLTDGTVEKAKKPTRFDELVAAKNTATAKKAKVLPRDRKSVRKTATRKVRKTDGLTKQDRVDALVKEHLEKFGSMPSRKDAIAHIVELGITTAAGASTMFANAKRKLG